MEKSLHVLDLRLRAFAFEASRTNLGRDQKEENKSEVKKEVPTEQVCIGLVKENDLVRST